MKYPINTRVKRLIETDDSYTTKSGERIRYLYENANPSEQVRIDQIFINLTGYSLTSILNTEKFTSISIGE